MKISLLLALLFCTNSFSQDINVRHLETCFSPREECGHKLIQVFNSAQKTIDIAIFSITHPGITKAIIAAKNRGVAIRIIVDKRQSEGLKSQVNKIMAASIPIKIGNASGTMHDKYSIIDGMIMQTGSFNYTTSATSFNTENQIYISDENAIKRYQENFEILWENGLIKN